MIVLILLICYIKSMDVRLSLGTDIGNNTYPVVITLREPLIYQINSIDLFLVYDISGSMGGKRLENLKKALLLVIDALESNDRLTLISFETDSKTELELEYMTKSKKRAAKSIIEKTKALGMTSFIKAINELVRVMKIAYKTKGDKVQSVIFLTDGVATDNNNLKDILKNALSSDTNKYDFTVNTFAFSSESAASNLVIFSDSRDGAFYSIGDNNLGKLQDYVLNTIGAMRTTSYKFVNMDINSNLIAILILKNFMEKIIYLKVLILQKQTKDE